MRIVVVAFAVACTGPTPDLETGRVKNLTWTGGLCPASFRCAGKLELEGDRVTARQSNGTLVGTATLSQALLDDVASQIAKIPGDQPLQGSTQGCAIDDSGGIVLGIDFELSGFRSYNYPCGALGGLGPVVTTLREVTEAFAQCSSTSRISIDPGCAP